MLNVVPREVPQPKPSGPAAPWVLARAQRDSIRSQTFHSKGTAYDITKYETFFTKHGIVYPFKRTLVNSRGTAYHIL